MRTATPERARYLVVASLGALGIVYGDIGTSPLYALREVFVAAEGLAVTRDTVFGVLSLVVWALVLVVTIKYLAFVMRADNDGEGGIMALIALVRPPRGTAVKTIRRSLILIGLFGTALLYGDGMITPAISVLAAVEGLEVFAPSLDSFVLPLAVGILIGLFSIQRRGTAAIGAVFGPVMTVWFGVIGALGLIEIMREPGILAAINPLEAVDFAVDQPRLAFLALGAIFLVVTGSEALYADMGHFGRRPIQLGWFTLVFPALLLNYFGQGALLISDPTAVDNPFYRLAPDWGVLPLVVLATMATVIASQALISGAFSLTMQAVQLGYLPRVRVDHTSPREIGQVYVASVNYLLMAAAIGLVLSFRSSSNLAAAYGVAVTTTMVITTLLLYVVMRERWHWSRSRAVAVTTLFLIVDVGFFSANIIKIPAGGWFPLVVGAVVFAIMATWRKGRAEVVAAQRRGELPIERFIASIDEHPQLRVPGTAVYLFPQAGATPPALLMNLRHNEILHETVVIVSVLTAGEPRVPQARRAAVDDLGHGFFQVVLNYGFMEDPNLPEALGNIVSPEFGFDRSDATYFLGKVSVVPGKDRLVFALRDHLFALMHRNASSASQHFGLAPDEVIQIGTVVSL
jgi:KUP system potassium uptake protein